MDISLHLILFFCLLELETSVHSNILQIPGPAAPKRMNIYMKIIVDQLNDLCEEGMNSRIFQVFMFLVYIPGHWSEKQQRYVKALLLNWLGDYPGLASVLHCYDHKVGIFQPQH
jgi:hypothetical protein